MPGPESGFSFPSDAYSRYIQGLTWASTLRMTGLVVPGILQTPEVSLRTASGPTPQQRRVSPLVSHTLRRGIVTGLRERWAEAAEPVIHLVLAQAAIQEFGAEVGGAQAQYLLDLCSVGRIADIRLLPAADPLPRPKLDEQVISTITSLSFPLEGTEVYVEYDEARQGLNQATDAYFGIGDSALGRIHALADTVAREALGTEMSLAYLSEMAASAPPRA